MFTQTMKSILAVPRSCHDRVTAHVDNTILVRTTIRTTTRTPPRIPLGV